MRSMAQSSRLLLKFTLLLVSAIALSGCLATKSYVDPGLPMAGKSDLSPPQSKQPVQVLFEFRTKGQSNANATDAIRPRVIAAAAESGLFSAVSAEPDSGEAGILTVVIDNIPVTDNPAAKGFGTGLTLGLAGTLVTDGYLCTAKFQRAGESYETTVKHALHTTIGNKKGPEGLQAMDMPSAVNQVMDQLIWNALKQLDGQQAFD